MPRKKVYTGTGDRGETSLFNGTRVLKDHGLVDAFGTVDECNAAIGLANSHLNSPVQLPDPARQAAKIRVQHQLTAIQNYLFDLGAHLATPRFASTEIKVAKTTFPETAVTQLEVWIDEIDAGLTELATFVLPGGHPAAASLHLARTIARRAERTVTPLHAAEKGAMDPHAYQFLNRLSDYLFVASRHVNVIMGVADVKWSAATGN